MSTCKYIEMRSHLKMNPNHSSQFVCNIQRQSIQWQKIHLISNKNEDKKECFAFHVEKQNMHI